MSKEHSCPFQKGTFVKKELLTSKAFLSLSKTGKTVLLLLLLKRQMPGNFRNRKNLSKDTILNNGEIELSYKELASLGFNTNQSARGFDDVIKKGFCKMVERGGKGKGSYNLYELIDDWQKYGTPDFKPRERIKSIGYGYCS
jgi:hypothetical protein